MPCSSAGWQEKRRAGQTGDYGQTCILVHNAQFCGADVVAKGKAGEINAGITKNTKIIEINGRNRIPDEVTDTMITEVKNVRYQYLSRQIQDTIDLSQKQNKTFRLVVRAGTDISKSLQAKIDSILGIIDRIL